MSKPSIECKEQENFVVCQVSDGHPAINIVLGVGNAVITPVNRKTELDVGLNENVGDFRPKKITVGW